MDKAPWEAVMHIVHCTYILCCASVFGRGCHSACPPLAVLAGGAVLLPRLFQRKVFLRPGLLRSQCSVGG